MNSDFFVILPLLLPLIFAVIHIFLTKYKMFASVFNIFGATLLLIYSIVLLTNVYYDGIQILNIGNWPSPYGIPFVADMLSAIMVLVSSIIFFVISIFVLSSIDETRINAGFFVFMNFMIAGIHGSFLTGDIFNLFVWFEVMLLSSFVMLSLGAEKFQLEGSMKYVIINIISSLLFLIAIGLLYGVSGTLNMAELNQRLSQSPNQNIFNIIAVLFIISLGIKSALFPFYNWLPASYHTPPIAVTALFAALMTKTGVYALIRIFTLIFTYDAEFLRTIIQILAYCSVIIGGLGAISQNDIRKILSFSIIAQVGFLLIGFSLYSVTSLTASVFMMVHVIFSKTALFLIAALLFVRYNSYNLNDCGSGFKYLKLLSVLFLISGGALASVPPLSGFWAKFLLILAGFQKPDIIAVLVIIVGSLLTLIYILRIWNKIFLRKIPYETDLTVDAIKFTAFEKFYMYLPVFIILLLLLYFSFYPYLLYTLSYKAAEQLMNPDLYINSIIR
jgi:multicomponent Na+:H+ antiporter subunit D